MKNIRNFETYVKEKFSLKDIFIKPKKIEKIDKILNEIDVNQPVKIFLFRSNNTNDNPIIKNFRISDCYIKQYKKHEHLNYDFVMNINDKNILTFDIFNKRLHYTTMGNITIRYIALTDKNGAEIIFKLLKEKIEDNNIKELSDVKLRDIPVK